MDVKKKKKKKTYKLADCLARTCASRELGRHRDVTARRSTSTSILVAQRLFVARQYKQTHDTKQRRVLGGCGIG
jgi:hypothetical protein